MVCASEPARTPEELEALLEDAALLGDDEAIGALFEPDGVVAGAAGLTGYTADPRTVVQAGDVALVLSPHGVSVVRRGTGGAWRFVICCRA